MVFSASMVLPLWDLLSYKTVSVSARKAIKVISVSRFCHASLGQIEGLVSMVEVHLVSPRTANVNAQLATKVQIVILKHLAKLMANSVKIRQQQSLAAMMCVAVSANQDF